MELERMCELLGFDYETRYVPGFEDDGIKETGFYVGDLIFTSDATSSPQFAERLLQSKIEQMILDIVQANRNLSNEDLAEIVLKKAQSNLMNDLTKLKENETNE